MSQTVKRKIGRREREKVRKTRRKKRKKTIRLKTKEEKRQRKKIMHSYNAIKDGVERKLKE